MSALNHSRPSRSRPTLRRRTARDVPPFPNLKCENLSCAYVRARAVVRHSGVACVLQAKFDHR